MGSRVIISRMGHTELGPGLLMQARLLSRFIQARPWSCYNTAAYNPVVHIERETELGERARHAPLAKLPIDTGSTFLLQARKYLPNLSSHNQQLYPGEVTEHIIVGLSLLHLL